MSYLIFLNCPVLLETAGGQNDECPVQKLVTTTLWHYYSTSITPSGMADDVYPACMHTVSAIWLHANGISDLPMGNGPGLQQYVVEVYL